jgi:dihydroorotate dehydrogenase
MKLRGIDFGHVLDASGARGWFGEGHVFHPLVPGLDFTGSTFVAKTTTLRPRRGNADIRADGLTPRVFPQRAVRVNWRKGVVLNAFGLPGPGIEALLETGRWQARKEPFFISFMALEASPQDSLKEVQSFVQILKSALPQFAAPVGLQVNYSCPNVIPHDHIALFSEHLNEYRTLDIPIVVKLSATVSVESAIAIERHPACDALCMSNSIAWGELADKIDWLNLWGRVSPLAHLGGGGLSGAPLLPIVADWIRRARRAGMQKHINAGGGILKPTDCDVLLEAGASSIFVGSIAMLRGWRLQSTIQHATEIFAAHERAPVLARLRA